MITTRMTANNTDDSHSRIARRQYHHHLPNFSTSAPCQYHRQNALTLYDLSLFHDGGNVLFQSSGSISLPHGSITGLVGTNGAGKTSFAKALASKVFDGFPQSLTVEYLAAADDEDGHEQEEDFESSLDSLPQDYIQSRIQARIELLQEQIDSLEQLLEQEDDADDIEETADQLSSLYEVQDSITAKMESEVEQSMVLIGLKPHAHKTLRQLSCGWRYKCRLIAALLTHPDLLIVDEPSFLDESSTDWLVTQLHHLSKDDNVIVLLISHKEFLLETLCDRILYINSASQTITCYACRYSIFRETLESEIQHASKTMEETEEKRQTAEKSLQRIQKVMQKRETNFNKTERSFDKAYLRGKCKEAKQNADRSAASKLKKVQQSVAQAQEQMQKAQRERVKPLCIEGMPATSGTLVTFQDVGVKYEEGQWVFRYVDTSLEVNDRILLKGPNGCGKSTLIKLILAGLEPTEGSVTRTTQNILYFPQTALHELLSQHGRDTAVDFLGENLTETQARLHLGVLGLAKNLALQPVNTLSAGQRVRLWLAKELLQHPKPSLLILDEMSENVDKETRKSLLDMLKNFNGAVLVVSHDPDFGDTFDFTKTWTMYPNGIHVQFPE